MVKFSVIVVALNPGEKLKKTIDSVLCQTCGDYEIVVKDGGSSDGSVETLPEEPRIRLFTEPDTGIYDAMNQAVRKAQGEYILFLNCGDVFYDRQVLERASACIDRERGEAPLVVYGDTYGAKNDVLIASPQRIDGFACYRNIPCHQSCFYEARLCREKPYNPEYRIRADYEHFLWCYYRAEAKMVHMGSVVSSYEGGGYSESRQNRRRDREEHAKITEEYMSPEELAGYRRAMLFTLAPLRSFLAENKLTSGIYHWLKNCFYHHKIRLLVGFVLFWAELALYFGTGIMLEDVTNFLSGEGSWEETQSEGTESFCQEFMPQYDNLQMVSFLMGKEHVTVQDGTVTVLLSDDRDRILFERTLGFEEISDGSFTDIEVGLKVSAGKKHYLTLVTSPSSAGEYPTVGVCGTAYYLPENRTLFHGDEVPEVQLVSRYEYRAVMPPSKARSIILLSLLTALGIMFGLPDNKHLRRATGILLLAAVPCVLGSRLELLTYKELFYLPIALRWNVGIMLALEIIVLLFTHSLRVSIVLTNAVLTVLYSANYFMIMYRGTALRMNDFTAIGTAAGVVGSYSLVPNDHLAMAWGLAVLVIVFGAQTGTGRLRLREKLSAAEDASGAVRVVGEASGSIRPARAASRPGRRVLSYAVTIAIGVATVLGGGYTLLYTDFLNRVGFADKELRGFSYELIYSFDGYLVATCIDVQNSRVTAPQGYSVEQTERILTKAAGGVGENPAAGLSPEERAELPHVILIMNESFADLRVLGDLDLNQENMAFFNSLRENTVRGYVNASVLGGGTANSEFEVLTGCSVSFFPVNYYPYQQGIKKPVASLVSQMQRCGYTAYSMHPKPAVNWNRIKIYEYLGFDRSLWEEDFEGAQVVHNGVSDEETFKKVIELYEMRGGGEKLFIFDLTMQNHAGYSGNKGPYEVKSGRMDNPVIDEYLSLIKISDEAFADLVGYFEKEDEKVVICMFGDHQPWISSLITGTDRTDAGQNAAQMMNMYKTPFVIWANYDIDEAEGYDISMNYLGGLLQETAGIPLSPYFAFLKEYREKYPIITLNGYVDGQGNYGNWGSEGDEFPEYRILQYNYMFDDDTVEWGY